MLPIRPGGEFDDGSGAEDESGDGSGEGTSDESDSDDDDSDSGDDDSQDSAARERNASKAIRRAQREARGEIAPATVDDDDDDDDSDSDDDDSGNGDGKLGGDNDGDNDGDDDGGDDGDDDDSASSTGSDSNPLGYLGKEDAADPEVKRREAAERARKRKIRDRLMKEARTQLPFTFEVPADHEALTELLHGRSLEDVSMILERMSACHHISLDPRNRAKLGRMVGLLLDHINELAAFDTSDLDADADADADADGDDNGDNKSKKNNKSSSSNAAAAIARARDEINACSRILIRIARQTPSIAVKTFRSRLSKLAKRLRKTLSGGAATQGSS
jgi:hypothetical protein